MQDTQEKTLYVGGPSQMLNFNLYFFCAIAFLFSIASEFLWKEYFHNVMAAYPAIYFGAAKLMFFVSIFFALKGWLTIRSHKYLITSERFKETQGILSRATHELELFRIRDITFSEPFTLRIIGCGDIILNTNDKTTPIVVIHGIKNAEAVMEILRRNVDIMRTKKGVREIEV